MPKVVADMSMSLDGYVADANDGVEHLFVWYSNGDVDVETNDERWKFKTSAASAKQVREALTSVGALVTGRRLFDMTKAWGGNHPTGAQVFVVTHSVPDGWPREDAPFTFVLDGVESAVAQAKEVAGEKTVAIASTTVAQQALDLGLVDEINVNLVPVLLGGGIPFFANLSKVPVKLTDPTIVQGLGVTHLTYGVLK